MLMKIIANPFLRGLLLLSLLAGLVVFIHHSVETKTRISNIVFDNYIQLQPRAASDKLVFVDIDDESLAKIGQWPWPRSTIADIIRNIAEQGAAVIIYDGVMAEPDRTSPENIATLLPAQHPAKDALQAMPGNDKVLAQAIGEAGNFVAGFSYGSNSAPPEIKSSILIKRAHRDFFLQQKAPGFYFKNTAQFLPELQEVAEGNGSFMAYADEVDSVIRQTGLIFHNGQTLYPSLILEGLRLYSRSKMPIKIRANADYSEFKINQPFQIEVGSYQIPASASGRMWVHYRHFRPEESVSAYKLLSNNPGPDPARLTDKVVFIASSAEGLMDLRSTPLGFKPGVEVHMNAFEQILQGNYLIRPYVADQLEIWGAALASLLIILASFFLGPVWLAFLTALLSCGAFFLSWSVFTQMGGLIDPVTPTLMMIIVFIVSSVLSFIRTEMEKRQVSTAFGHYISPDFMEELTKNPDKLKLGGEIRDLTILFSDIRSFTTISEGLTPEELIQLMNDFLTPMSDLVMKNKGTIDKYMGDAMMAFWNAPLDDPDHARHACIAALGMQKALAPINEEVRKKAEALGKKPVLLQAGIGINTGPCAVGNMGSKQRFAYSTLGDAVNLASRLEGQTKNYGTGILIGEETQKRVPDFATLEFDLIQVKGKTQPEHVYGLLGDEQKAQGKKFRKLAETHAQMLQAYRSKQFDKALELLQECRDFSDEELAYLYDLYEERIQDMKTNPPPADWDGVYIATSK